MPARFTTSVLVRNEGKMLIFDAGEGIQIALKKGGLGIRGLDAVVISHLHADHTLGLPGIMMFRAQNDNPGPFTIIGPPGIERFVRNTIEVLGCHISYDYTVIECNENTPETVWRWGSFQLKKHVLEHSTFCLGYRLEEDERPGIFSTENAAVFKIPKGPMFGKLQKGHAVTLEDGRTVEPSEVMGPPRPGRIVAFATDTRPCKGLLQVLNNADLAFVEGMFAEEHQDAAIEKKHMTAKESALSAKQASVKRAVLVHISPRYTLEDESSLEKEAKSVFSNAEISKPLKIYEVPLKS